MATRVLYLHNFLVINNKTRRFYTASEMLNLNNTILSDRRERSLVKQYGCDIDASRRDATLSTCGVSSTRMSVYVIA